MIEIGSHQNPKILIVDDESEVLNSLADLLRKEFHIFATSDVGEAQTLLASQHLFSMIIADQRMPLLTGAELLARAAEICPDTARILLTGYADLEVVIDAVNQGKIVQYFTKPWDAANLLKILKPIAERYQLVQENHRLVKQLAELNQQGKEADTRIETLEDSRSSLEGDNRTLKAAYDHLDQSFWHLRKIQEVLPICMECGKVKTTETSWEDVVSYLKKNTMFLSHGYCPECANDFLHQQVVDQAGESHGA